MVCFQIVSCFADIFHDATIYTSICNRNNLFDNLKNKKIITAFKNRKNSLNHRKYYPFLPAAFESFDLTDYDLVISSSSSCAKCVKSYQKTLIKYFMNYMRMWDVTSSSRVDYFIANSQNVAKKIQKYYRRDSTVITPPVDTDFFIPGTIDEEYFLIVSRFVKYKRIDLAIEAFNELGLPLKILGDGPEYKHLNSIKLVSFLINKIRIA